MCIAGDCRRSNALPHTLLQGFGDIGFSHILAPLEDIAAAARLRTILASSTLHDALAHYVRVATSDGAILGALGADFCVWHATVRTLLRGGAAASIYSNLNR